MRPLPGGRPDVSPLDPDRIDAARPAATLARLIGAGELGDRGERGLAEWETSQPAGERLDDGVAFHWVVDQETRA